ncbi:Sm [Musa troglodytarum]|uniref:Sm n=1 Tax=Musa troglodytarum TaxID=320322 RepID=A0A9E7GY61_9LILI|nr:Sm [Musa troglodytarum]
MLFFSYFKELVGKEVTVELKNDLAIRGTLHSVDQYLNIKLENIRVVDQDKYPHMAFSSLYFFFACNTICRSGIVSSGDRWYAMSNSLLMGSTSTSFTMPPGEKPVEVDIWKMHR